eukprot:Lithocolla_globosa_v1_NODE_10140_length_630_cov_260.160000.p1 type:complete len:140 gc:universal NODE_10140_length_630_cov_260.160000:147-566(+)
MDPSKIENHTVRFINGSIPEGSNSFITNIYIPFQVDAIILKRICAVAPGGAQNKIIQLKSMLVENDICCTLPEATVVTDSLDIIHRCNHSISGEYKFELIDGEGIPYLGIQPPKADPGDPDVDITFNISVTFIFIQYKK